MNKIFIGLLIALFLIGISYFNTKVYGYGLKLNSQNTKILFFIFLLIPLLFALSMVLGFEGLMPNILHRIIQMIAGFGLFLFFGAIVLGIIYSFGFLFRVNLPSYLSYVFFILSLVLASIGYIQARFIKVVDYTIKSEKVPESLLGKKAILISDTHFGKVNHKYFSDKIVNKIITLNPDFVLHAGDFYDGPKNDTKPITLSWFRLAEKFPVFMAPGNHEEYGDYRGFLKSIADAGVNTLEDQKIAFGDIEIVGIKYRENLGKKNTANLEIVNNALKNLNLDPNKFTILINHAPTALKVANDYNIDLQVSGHTHKGQFWPLNYIVKSIYKEYTYGLNPYQNLQVLTTSGVGTASVPSRLFNTPELVRITFDK